MKQIRLYPILLLAFLFLAQGLTQARGTKNYEGVMKTIPKAAIVFASGSSLLTGDNRAILRSIIQDARAKGAIEQVTVAAWSDNNLPATGKSVLEADRTLAKKRADAIVDFLKSEENVTSVNTFNMAESTNWLARTFNTRDAELKSIFGKKAADLPVTNAEFQIIKNEGGPSKAVVLVEREMP